MNPVLQKTGTLNVTKKAGKAPLDPPAEFWPSREEMAKARRIACVTVEIVDALRKAQETVDAKQNKGRRARAGA